MTLLLRRQPDNDAECFYAVQITFPKEMCPGAVTSFTSVRLIDKRGIKSLASETIDSYRPEEWRAADLSEQALYAAQFNGNPQPWYCVMGSLFRNVYDWPGSGDKDTNNGQEWPGIENLDREWKTGRKAHKKCEEELDAEWNTRIANETRAASNSLGQKDSVFYWRAGKLALPEWL
jgi:hypothetical protein